MRKTLVFLVVISALLALVLSCTPSAAPAPAAPAAPGAPAQPADPKAAAPGAKPASKVIELSQGSTSATSGSFVYAVGVSRAINKYLPEVNVTTVVTGATYDNLGRMMEGTFDFCTNTSDGGCYEAYNGLESFKDKPFPEVRGFFLMDRKVFRFYARQDSGIESWDDLAASGKELVPGIPGSAAAMLSQRAEEVLGTGVDIRFASLGDGWASLKAGRIGAVNKSSPPYEFDPGGLAVHLLTPLNPVGFTKEQADAINARYPVHSFELSPKGLVGEAPEWGDLYETYFTATSVSHSGMSQELGYKIVKTVSEHWDVVVSAYPPAAKFKDPVETFIGASLIPLHAGTVQYALEVGYDVPADKIPPEYKAP
ncbi:TAXI family TRAP transporter solute-binding subunit [Chloroflexota bacterium]